ncbi:hypothetical protein C4K10_4379 [Pseudomonas chlororaphis subsp. aureofaciens]|uniref:hypothetical protein n=1 Tax=Pseudomonas chlororaphis TaxID=587753 RepID=UPI000F578B7F|nr:hypothetical protein [Pseudomonas chlororaphis]AZE12645.1 hypothetical protein C4K10_4379 [Pseudomonas chlororaphis subsp. aureofaciens]
MILPAHDSVTSLEMAMLANRPRRFIHRDITTLLTKLSDAGLIGSEVGDGGLLRWFNKKACTASYWVAGEYQYTDSRNRKQTALYIAKNFLMVIAGRIDCDVTRRLYVSMI